MRSILLACTITACALPHLAAQAGPELLLPGLVSTSAHETSAAFTPSGDSLFFMRADATFQTYTILVAVRRDGIWMPPEVADFSGVWRDAEPAVSPDGRFLAFASNRPDSGRAGLVVTLAGRAFPGSRLWVMERTPQGWTAPQALPASINGSHMVYAPAFDRDGNLWFSGAVGEPSPRGTTYRAPRTGNGWGAPEAIFPADPRVSNIDPAPSPDGSFLVFASSRAPSISGVLDLWLMPRGRGGEWGEPIHLGDVINAGAGQNAPSIGPDGTTLHFTSMRGGPPRDSARSREDAAALARRLASPHNGSRNVYAVDLTPWLVRAGVR